jgi:hypothetical protein
MSVSGVVVSMAMATAVPKTRPSAIAMTTQPVVDRVTDSGESIFAEFFMVVIPSKKMAVSVSQRRHHAGAKNSMFVIPAYKNTQDFLTDLKCFLNRTGWRISAGLSCNFLCYLAMFLKASDGCRRLRRWLWRFCVLMKFPLQLLEMPATRGRLD